MSGYVRIHRSLIGHPSFRNDAEAMAFAWMVTRAAWKPVRVRYKDRTITLQRGQLSVSQRDMAKAMDRDKAWVERLWKRLRGEAMIDVVSEAGVAVVTICNYAEYQAPEQEREAADEARGEAGARQAQGTEQIREEVKKEEEDEASPHCARAPAQPVTKAKDIWNEEAVAAGWPTVQSAEGNRGRSLSNRLREHGLDGWRQALQRARSSPYLGRDPPGWFTFDWIIKPTNFLKVIEGNYDRRNHDRGSGERMGGPGPDPTLALVRAATAAQRQDTRDRGQAWPALPPGEHG